MKRVFLSALLTLILMAASSIVSADQATPPKIRIAAFNFYPTLFQAQDGTVKGFYVDFLNEIAAREGWEIEYVYGNWADGLARIENGEVDVLTNVAYTAERSAFMDYGKIPLLTVWSELYVPTGSEIENIRDVKDKKIALMRGDHNAANFRNLVEKFGIPCQYVEFGNFEEVFKAISARQVDGGVVNNTFGSAKQSEYDLKSSGVIFNPFDIFFTVAKGKNSTVLTTLDKYLDGWRKTESSPYHLARERWSHGSASTIRVVHPWMKNAVIFFAVLLCGTVVFVFLLRTQVRRKTSEIQKYSDELHLMTLQLEEELAERQVAQEALQDQAVILEEEIAERIEMSRALDEKNKEMEAFFSNSLALLCIADTTGRFLRLNPEWTNVLGYSLSEMEGTNYISYVHPDDVDATVNSTTQLAGQRPVLRFTNRYRTKAGNYRVLEWMAYPSGDRIYAAARDITQQKFDEEMLLENQERLELAISSANMGVWSINLQEDVRFFNDHACSLIGLDPATFKGTHEEFYSVVHAEDLERIKSALVAAIETDTPYSVEYRVVRPDGSLRHIASRAKMQRDASLIADRCIGVLWDVSEQKQAEEELTRLIREQAAVLDNAPVGISLIRDRKLIWVNKKMEEIFQYPKEELEGDIARKFYLSDQDYEQLGKEAYPNISQGMPYETVRQLVRRDGSTLWARYNGTAVDPEDTSKGTIWILDDITSQIQAEAEKNKLHAQLNQAQKLETVGRLAGGIAHDFNNKLTVIMGYSELSKMRLCGKNKECGQNVEEILQASQHAQEITKRLLTFSRNDTISPLKLDLNSLLKGIYKTLGRMIGEQVNIHIELQEDLWPVRIDPTQFDQMITNLVVNARDAMPQGGDITLATKNILIGDYHSEVPAGEYVRISCSDTGCGMDAGILDHIFEPFFTTKETGKGTGLGLSSVYGIVKQNNGSITVQSRPGEGSVFSIFLPRLVEKAACEDFEAPAKPVQGQGTLLLVEDEEPVRRVTRLMLENIGYVVIASETPEEAVSICADPAVKIDCVISDVIMPGMNGKELQERISCIRPDLPFIFVSGYTADIVSTQLKSGNEIKIVQKPINYKILNDEITQLIGTPG